MTRTLSHILLAAAIALLSACSNSSSEAPDPPIQPGPEPLDKVGRTVLVYMVANCNLGDDVNKYDTLDLEEMLQLKDDECLSDSRIVVYRHPLSGTPKLMVLTPDGFTELIEYDAKEYSVSSKRMLEVIADAQRIAPAERFGLVLWSHASGWVQDGLRNDMPTLKSYGEDRGRTMNVTTLAAVLEGKGFDFIYFDCCHMANVETLYQMRHCAKTFIGSTTIVPGEGMPYNLTMPHLLRYDADCVGAAQQTFAHYDAMSGEDRSIAISVIDATKLDALADATRRAYATDFSLPAFYSVQQFERASVTLCRYYDFKDYIHAACPDEKAIFDFDNALDDAVVYKANTPSIWGNYLQLKTHCGLSTFILNSADYATKSGYNELEWWDDVASRLFAK